MNKGSITWLERNPKRYYFIMMGWDINNFIKRNALLGSPQSINYIA